MVLEEEGDVTRAFVRKETIEAGITVDLLEELERGLGGCCGEGGGGRGVGGVREVFVCEAVICGGYGEGFYGDFFEVEFVRVAQMD